MTNEVANEISVIGSLLISPCVFEIVAKKISADDFDNETTRAAFSAMERLYERGDPIDDPNVVAHEMQASGLADNGQARFLAECMSITPTAANIELYCDYVAEQSRKRNIAKIADELTSTAVFGGNCQAGIDQALMRLSDIKSKDKALIDSLQGCRAYLDNIGLLADDPEALYCRTGYANLDRMLGGGLSKQGVTIIGARPGMGKTTLGVNIAEQVAMRDKPALFVSLEMTKEQITAKRVARQAKIDYNKVLFGRLDDGEKAKMTKSLNVISQRPFYMTEATDMTVSKIGVIARQIDGLALVVVDYFSLIAPENPEDGKTRVEQTTEISKALMCLSKRISVPIVCLCQLNRNQTQRASKRPVLTDLRETGALEQDATAVILLHRENYEKLQTDPDAEAPKSEEIELILAKNRNAIMGTAKLTWFGASGLIADIDARRP
jgi:replicative DNA helicase